MWKDKHVACGKINMWNDIHVERQMWKDKCGKINMWKINMWKDEHVCT